MARDSRINISVNIVHTGDDQPDVFVGRSKDGNAALHAKVKKCTGGKYIIDAMLDGDGHYELEDLAQTAFELGRSFQKRYGKPGAHVPRS